MRKQNSVTVKMNVFTATIQMPDGSIKTIHTGAGDGEAILRGFMMSCPEATTISKETEKASIKLSIDDVLKYGVVSKNDKEVSGK